MHGFTRHVRELHNGYLLIGFESSIYIFLGVLRYCCWDGRGRGDGGGTQPVAVPGEASLRARGVHRQEGVHQRDRHSQG